MTRARDVSNIDGLLTTKGDIYAATAAGVVVRQGVGANGTVLTANSALDDGLEWATPAAGGMTLLSTTSFSGASTTVTGISGAYKDLKIIVKQFSQVSDGNNFFMRLNADSTANRHQFFYSNSTTVNGTGSGTFARDYIQLVENPDNTATNGIYVIEIPDYANTTSWKIANFYGIANDATTSTAFRFTSGFGVYNQTSAISSMQFLYDSTNADGGTIEIYGVK